jgi:tungstate transport system permease protein
MQHLAHRRGISLSDSASAFELLLTGDPALLAIVQLSLVVSLSAVAVAALVGVPSGAALALTRFAGREVVVVMLNALMGLPPVVVGLAVYLLLSRSGPLGAWGLLFTPQAMIIAQTILVAPIIAALTRQTIEDLSSEYRDELAAMDVGPLGRIATLIWDGRFSLITALLAGFGRAAAEVGAVIIVGGNIEGFTRTMTTAIALETSKGELSLAIGLGTVLIAIVVAVNAGAWANDLRDDHARARLRSADRARRRQRRRRQRETPGERLAELGRWTAYGHHWAERRRQDHAAASRHGPHRGFARTGDLGRARERRADAARDRVPAAGDAPSQHGGQHPLRTRRCRRCARCARCAPARARRPSRPRQPR